MHASLVGYSKDAHFWGDIWRHVRPYKLDDGQPAPTLSVCAEPLFDRNLDGKEQQGTWRLAQGLAVPTMSAEVHLSLLRAHYPPSLSGTFLR